MDTPISAGVPLDEFLRLNTTDKLTLIDALWDSIESQAIPMPDGLVEELDQRKAALDSHPETAIP